MAADLLAAGSEGRGDEVVRILEVDSELLRVGDLNGDTVLHLLVTGGFVKPLLQLYMFIRGKNPKLLKEVATQGNANGDTPLHLAVKKGHKRIANILVNVQDRSFYIENDDGESPLKLGDEMWGWGHYDIRWKKGTSSKEKLMRQKTMLLLNEGFFPSMNENKDKLSGVYVHLLNARSASCQFLKQCASFSDMNIQREIMATVKTVIHDGKILEMLEVDPNLIRFKNWRGETIFHDAAASGDVDLLTKLVGHVTTSRMTRPNDQFQLPSLVLGNKNGCTPLHLALNRRKMKASRYLMEVAPEAAYRVNNNGESPLYVAIKEGHDELVKCVLQVMPEASMSPAIRSSLLTPNKTSLPHAAIKLRKLNMFQLLFESIPSLIDSLDEKGWKPLSYASFKGYVNDVWYLLNKFPESVKKFDSDGSLPIHKAVSGGHVCIIKAFISIHPQTLYSIDQKGRNILHIAVMCRKTDILYYLRDEVNGVEKLYELRDNNNKTYADYAPRKI